MHIQPFQALYPNTQSLAVEPSFFDTAKENYQQFLQRGFFKKTEHPAIYIYQIQAPKRVFTGILACADIAHYLEGDIKKHENTIRAEEEKQMRLTLERQAAVKPVLLTYPENESIDRWIADYISQHTIFLEVEFPQENQVHRIWLIENDAAIATLQTLFDQKVPHAYIADGHHRMSAIELMVQNTTSPTVRAVYSQVYCAFFPSQQLDILEFNRVVELTENIEVPDFLKKIKILFDIEQLSAPAKPQQPHEMTLCCKNEWYRLKWKSSVLSKFAEQSVVLDTMLLNELVLGELLDIKNLRKDRRLEYIDAQQGLTAIQNRVLQNPYKIGFCLYPVSFGDLVALVEAGGTMPPKSTWFEPRMKNGLIVKPYEMESMN